MSHISTIFSNTGVQAQLPNPKQNQNGNGLVIVPSNNLTHNPEGLSNKKIQPFTPSTPLLKTWEIVLCAVTIIGLLVLLGIYYKRKSDRKRELEKKNTPLEIIQTPSIIFCSTIPQDPPYRLIKTEKENLPSKISPDPDIPLKLEKENILKENPLWVPIVNEWKEISISDQVWLLQLFELRKFHIPIEELDKNMQSDESILPTKDLSKILMIRKEIEENLSSIKMFSSIGKYGTKISYIPSAISLLKNLEQLWVPCNEISSAPDLSKNVKLNQVNLAENKLTSPPDLSQNINITWLTIANNALSNPPVLDNNKELKCLWLEFNKLTIAPDVSKNPKLEILALNHNQITTPPDVTRNPLLTFLNLGSNKLTDMPDISKNRDLELLEMSLNPLSSNTKKSLKSLKKTSTIEVYFDQ